MNSLTSGESRRDAVLHQFEVTQTTLILIAQHLFLSILQSKGNASANDLNVSKDLPPKISRCAIGAVIRGLARAGVIRKSGKWVRTTRPAAHARDIPVWELTSQQAVTTWIAARPVPVLEQKPLRQQSLFREQGNGRDSDE